MATALGVCVFVRMWHLLVLYAILMGLSASHQQYNPASASMVAESVRREERGTAYGVLMAFSVIVSAITAPLGGLLAMAYGFHPIFYACIAADLLCGLLTWLFIEETLEGAGRTRAQPRREWRDALRGALRPETELRGLYVSMTVVGFAWGLVPPYFTACWCRPTAPRSISSVSYRPSRPWRGRCHRSLIPIGKLTDRYGRKPFLPLPELAGMVALSG